MKNLEELKSKDEIKEILDTTKIARDNPKIWKEYSPLFHFKEIQHK